MIYDNGDVLHVRMKVRYSDFVKARADVKIYEVEGDAPKKEIKSDPPPPKKP